MADGWLVREREAWVATTAILTGTVEIAPEVNVWYGVSIRGDEAEIRIGARTNIQDNSVLHCDPGEPMAIGEDCTVGHGAILHGMKIGDRCLIGMGAILLQRSVVGDECLVAAGAVVPEGMEIPPRSVVMGVPAKVVRKVTDEEVKSFLASAKGYTDLASRTAAREFSRIC